MSPTTTLMNSPADSHAQKSDYNIINLQSFIRGTDDPGYTTTLPVLDLDFETWENDQDKKKSSMKLNGVFVLRNTSYQGYITEGKMIGLRWFQKHAYRLPIELSDGTISMEKPNSKIAYQHADGRYLFDVSLRCHGNLVEWLGDNKSEDQIKEKVSTQIEKEIRSTFIENIKKGMDIYNLRHLLYQGKINNWEGAVIDENSLEKVNVQVVIDHTGRKTID